MSRALSAGMVSAISGATVQPSLIFAGVFQSSTLRLWTGYGNLSWGGFIWLGNGWFKGISDIGEDGQISASNLDIALSGVPLSLVSLILGDAKHSCRGSVWLVCRDSAGAIVADPYLLFEGALSAPRIDDSGDQSQIILTYEDDMIMLQRASELRTNRESQHSIFPDDLGFDYVPAATVWTGFWGNKEKPKPPTVAKRGRTIKNKGTRR